MFSATDVAAALQVRDRVAEQVRLRQKLKDEYDDKIRVVNVTIDDLQKQCVHPAIATRPGRADEKECLFCGKSWCDSLAAYDG